MDSDNKLKCVLLFLLFGAITFFSFYKLGSVIFNVDAHHWYRRSLNFTDAILTQNFADTFQDPKPGVMLMWLSGFSVKTFLSLYTKIYGFTPHIFTQDTFTYVHFAAKAPLVIINICFLLFFYKILKRLFNSTTAFASTALLGLHPYYLGVVRFVHVDGLLTFFMGISALSLIFVISHKLKHPLRIVALSGVFAGFALLTKLTAVFLLPYLILLLIIGVLFKLIDPRMGVNILSVWMIASLLIICLLYPALWVAPLQTVSKTFSEAAYVVEVGNTRIRPFSYYFSSILRIFGLTFVFMAITGGSVFCKSLKTKDLKTKFLMLSIVSYILFYFLQMSLVPQKIDRYLLPLFPFLAIFCGMFGSSVEGFLANRNIEKRLFLPVYLALLLGVISYYTPNFVTFGGNTLETNSSGSLYNEVGMYLNSKPGPTELKVVAMTKAQSLRPFVKGKVYGHEEEMPEGWTADYLVTNEYWISQYGLQERFNNCIKEHTITFRGNIYWDIYKCKLP